MPKTTITVAAEPEALDAAMKALEKYQAAQGMCATAVARAALARDAAVKKADEVYEAATKKAEGALSDARKAAQSAGVRFGDAPTRRPRSAFPLPTGKVLRVVPSGKANAMTVGEIAQAAGRSPGDTADVSKALSALVNDKKVKKVGERRGTRYYV